MKIDLTKIKINPNNPRLIKDDKFKKLCSSIRDFPKMLELRPIVIDSEGLILGGNMRFRALKENRMELRQEWFKEADQLTEDERRRFIIEDNVGFGDWDWDILANEYEREELEEWGMDVDKWSDDEIVEDEAPEVSDEEPESKLGEVYQMGKHRVMCGDSTKIEDVQKLMSGQMADMVFTDPPYNVDYVGKNKKALKIMNDVFTDEKFYQFLLDAFTNMSVVTKQGGSIYVCHADMWGYTFRKAFVEAGYLLKQCIIWNKNSMVMGRQDYQWKHEPILYGWKDGGSHQWYGDRKQTTVWDINKPSTSDEHPTMKPVSLVAKAISNSSKQDDIILDLFGGSGTTMIASEQTERRAYLMELDPKYTDVIRKRYAKFVGKGDLWQEITPRLE